ncbi:MAG: hypothetical protein QCH96_03630 [Candidatus Thermoplasmatota archaeon]|nr:hypothetical protein [Candidatus Thermoplasmatota archaeon]
MDEKIIEVKCRFCGKDIECPSAMQHIEDHCCSECYEKINDGDIKPEEGIKDIHVDIPMCDFIDNLAEDATENLFPLIWKEYKKEKATLSKKELARAMFTTGFAAALDFLSGDPEQEEPDE